MRRAFTLVELLIVVVILGLLAAIAIPKFNDTKRKAFVAAMKANLRRGVVEAEAYFADNGTYVGIQPPAGGSGVVMATIYAEPWGYAFSARHPRLPENVCVVAGGRMFDGGTVRLSLPDGSMTPLREGMVASPWCK